MSINKLKEVCSYLMGHVMSGKESIHGRPGIHVVSPLASACSGRLQ